MSQEPQQWRKGEKDEKREEKEEKERGEKMRSDPLSTIVWAAIFVWAGLVLLADNFDLLGEIRVDSSILEAWNLIFIGAGVIVLLEVAVRLIVPVYRRAVTGSLIFAFILLAVGLGGWIGWGTIWPLILILIGVSILVGAFVRR